MAAPMDFNVNILNKPCLIKTLAVASKLGYEAVAVNYVVENIDNTMRKKKKDKDYKEIKSPEDIILDADTLKSIKSGRKQLRQLSRFSTVIDNSNQLHKLQTPDIQAFDLIAVKPMTEKLFQIAVKTLNIDIVTIDVTQKLPYPIKRPTINVALERGIYFELEYSPAIRDSTYRKYMISNAQTLMRVCKAKNVIISSGCEKAMDLRGPHDVTNLGLLFGMSQVQAKAAITTNCQSLLLHAESRKLLKSTIGVVKTSQIDEKDKWILKQSLIKQEEDEHHCDQTVEESKNERKNDTKQDNKQVKRRATTGDPLGMLSVKKPKLDVETDKSNEIIK